MTSLDISAPCKNYSSQNHKRYFNALKFAYFVLFSVAEVSNARKIWLRLGSSDIDTWCGSGWLHLQSNMFHLYPLTPHMSHFLQSPMDSPPASWLGLSKLQWAFFGRRSVRRQLLHTIVASNFHLLLFPLVAGWLLSEFLKISISLLAALEKSSVCRPYEK